MLRDPSDQPFPDNDPQFELLLPFSKMAVVGAGDAGSAAHEPEGEAMGACLEVGGAVWRLALIGRGSRPASGAGP